MKGIKIMGFDLDQTLYPLNDNIQRVFRNEIYKLISKYFSYSLEKAKKVFEGHYKRLGSGAKTLEYLGIPQGREKLDECFIKANPWRFLLEDEKLVSLFKKINLPKFLITNGPRKSAIKTLEKTGLSLNLFSFAIFGDSKFGNKVDGGPFKEAIKITNLRPEEHLFIGDSEIADIEPAKSVGMKTCFVWGKSEKADFCIETIYDLEKLFS